MNNIFTIGYGSNKPQDFLARLKDAGITHVLDVRRANSKSWCGSYVPGPAMNKTIHDANIEYREWPGLGNKYDTLDAYRDCFLTSKDGNGLISYLAEMVRRQYRDKVCILCSERHAYRGGKVNCHRVYVAEKLVEELRE